MSEPVFPHGDDYDAGKPVPVTLAGPAGDIEAIVEGPEPDTPARPLVAVICHPLPTEGGTMHNKVVTMTARAFHLCGASTVRFNFRGVGKSAGEWDEGRGESGDLRAVFEWARRQRPDAEVWLAGFSFGSFVAYTMANELKPGMLVMIAPPAERERYGFEDITPFDGPWLVIQGEADEVVDPQAVYDWVESLPQPPELVRIPDTSHFFHRKLMDLRGAVRNGIGPYLPEPAAGAVASADE